MIEKILLDLVRRMPRGGFRAVRFASRYLGRLRDYPISLTLVPGRTVRADLSESVWYPLWRYGNYPHQIVEDRIALELVRPGDVVWDVGANIGYTALLFYRALKGEGSVVCFEPSRRAFKSILRTVEGLDSVHAYNLAIADTQGVLFFKEAAFLDTSMLVEEGDPDSYEVPVESLDHWFQSSGGPPPTFLKVDVEGAEERVFVGGQEIIRNHLPMIGYEALDEQTRFAHPEQLSRISGGAYAFYCYTTSGQLLPFALHSPETCTNNYLAVAEKDKSRLVGLCLT